MPISPSLATSRSTASSPRPVSKNESPSMPLVWVTSMRSVIDDRSGSPASRSSGSSTSRVSSSETSPASTRPMTSVAVYIFVSEPIWNIVSGVAGSPVKALRSPAAASSRVCPCWTPTAMPGRACLSTSSATKPLSSS
jgi:hypothetical protein